MSPDASAAMAGERARELHALRPVLMRLARLQLRNDAWAEDVVSETIVAALESRATFEARAKFTTWVVGILKHKIVDAFRARRREEPLADRDDADLDDELFRPDGHYRDWPVEWTTPESQHARNQFLETLEACMRELPAAQGRIFLMREWLELSTIQICKELTITATNAGVLLHRARMRLRECLNVRWFQIGSS